MVGVKRFARGRGLAIARDRVRVGAAGHGCPGGTEEYREVFEKGPGYFGTGNRAQEGFLSGRTIEVLS